MGCLLAIGAPTVLVDFPNEAKTGADMRWDFANMQTGAFFSLFIQAKKLHDRGGPWRDHSYDELFYFTGSTASYQAEVLCDYARTQNAAYPLYAFYNQDRSCRLARADGIGNVAGVNLADGFEIERRVLAATTRPLRQTTQKLGALQPLLFFLSDLFCPPRIVPISRAAIPSGAPPMVFSPGDGAPTFGFIMPPRPEDIRQRLVELLRRTRDQVSRSDGSVPNVPPLAQSIPHDVLFRIARHREGAPTSDEERAPYWRATFVSIDPSVLDDD